MKMKGSKYITCVCTHTDTRVPGKRWYHRCTELLLPGYCILQVHFTTGTLKYRYTCREKYLTFMLQVAGINTCCKYELLDFLFCYTQIDHY